MADLKQVIQNLDFPLRSLPLDSSKTQAAIPCCKVLQKPAEKILLRYEPCSLLGETLFNKFFINLDMRKCRSIFSMLFPTIHLVVRTTIIFKRNVRHRALVRNGRHSATTCTIEDGYGASRDHRV